MTAHESAWLAKGHAILVCTDGRRLLTFNYVADDVVFRRASGIKTSAIIRAKRKV